MVDYNFPKSFEGSFTIEGKVSQDFIDWALKPLDPKQTLQNAERLMKEYNIPKENMIADYLTLKWLFLKENQNTLEDEGNA